MTQPPAATSTAKSGSPSHLGRRGREGIRLLNSRLRESRKKVESALEKWAENRTEAEHRRVDTREQTQELLAPVREKIEEEKALAGKVLQPVHWGIAAVRGNLDPKNGRTRPYVTSFMISSVLCWVFGPQLLLAAYDRIVLLSGRTLIAPARDASVLAAGHGADWGILHGPGRWFRDTARMASETGQTAGLIWAALLGLLPMIILGIRNAVAAYLGQFTYQSKVGEWVIKRLTLAAYLAPVLYLIVVGYADWTQRWLGFAWVFHWWQVWTAALFCTAYYCLMWVLDRVEKRLPLGGTHVVLMMPVASIVTGALLNAPDAAW